LIKYEAAAMHMEDQVQSKRCGHRPGKALVSSAEMCDRIKAAVDARSDPNFVIMARTDALASEGLSASLERALAYVEAGADMIFAEAVMELSQYKAFVETLSVPVLANLTEFGKSPLFTHEELASVGVSMALYPLSAFRAMNAAALEVFDAIRHQGTQKDMLSRMQSRDDLYQTLDYYAYEEKIDQLFKEISPMEDTDL
jgi:methylisocitrate lyase